MAPKFGTSGLRGLVYELTDDLVSGYIRAFAATCDTGGQLCVGRDLRPSSPGITRAVVQVASCLTSAPTGQIYGFEQRRISGSSKPIWSEDEQEIRNIEGRR